MAKRKAEATQKNSLSHFHNVKTEKDQEVLRRYFDKAALCFCENFAEKRDGGVDAVVGGQKRVFVLDR